MKILRFCTAEGGSPARLHRSLVAMNVDSTMMVAHKRSNDPTVKRFNPPADLVSRIRRRFRKATINREMTAYANSKDRGLMFFNDRSHHDVDCLDQIPPFDVLHLHNTFNLVDFRGFFDNLAGRGPVIRSLHDQSFFTGGCHYAWDCTRYTGNCGKCPQLGSQDEEDLSRRIWTRKSETLGALPPGRLHIVATSRWLVETARASSLLRDTPITRIPLALDTEAFRPRNREFARDLLDIPQDVRVILFVAQPLERKEKGYALLAEALHGSDRSNVLLLTVGGGKAPVDVRIPHIHAGHVAGERMLSLYFSAADMFVMPSLQEAFGQVAIEASACGTPVIGFDTGGISDIVRHGETGFLVPVGDVDQLRVSIEDLLDHDDLRKKMSVEGRRVAEQEYSLDVQARRYIDLYQKVLDEYRSGVGSPG